MMVDKNGQRISSGILVDVRVTADTNSNSLIINAPSHSMGLIEALVDRLDQLPDAETQIKVFQVTNGDATELLTVLEGMFGTDQAGGNQFGGGAQLNTNNLPLQSASARDGNALVNLRFSADARTNCIIASGPVGDLQVIEDLLFRLDEADFGNRINTAYRLSNAPAEDVALALNNWLTSRQAIIDADPTSASAVQSTRRSVVVEPELVSNTLLISATPEYYNEVIGIIESLDRRPAMVKIKIMIAEVNLNQLSEFGLEFGIQDSLLFDRGIGAVGFPFNQQGLGNNSDALALGTREALAGQALSNFNVGRVNSDLAYGGLVLSAGNESINILLRALQHRDIVRVLSKPHITTVDNLQGRIQVGAQVPRIESATPNTVGGGVTTTVSDVSVGVILEITPRISLDGVIILNVDAINSSLGPEEQGVPVFISDGEVVRSPLINITQAQTTIMAQSGQTVVFSGLIQETSSAIDRGLPILSDLPVIGPLFGFEQNVKERKELLIIMTPYIVETDAQVSAMNQAEMDRMHWCLSDVADIYGSIGYDEMDLQHLESSSIQTFYPDQDPLGKSPTSPSTSSPTHYAPQQERDAAMSSRQDSSGTRVVPNEPTPRATITRATTPQAPFRTGTENSNATSPGVGVESNSFNRSSQTKSENENSPMAYSPNIDSNAFRNSQQAIRTAASHGARPRVRDDEASLFHDQTAWVNVQTPVVNRAVGQVPPPRRLEPVVSSNHSNGAMPQISYSPRPEYAQTVYPASGVEPYRPTNSLPSVVNYPSTGTPALQAKPISRALTRPDSFQVPGPYQGGQVSAQSSTNIGKEGARISNPYFNR